MSAAPGGGFRDRIAAGEPLHVIVFELGGQMHACDVLLVEEVVTRRRVHPLPDMPPRLLGVLRLRGELVPVMDVAPLLAMVLRPDADTILVLDDGERRVGVAADYVHDVLTLPADALRPAPGADAHVAAVARLDGVLYTLVDLAEILREQSTTSLRGAP